MTPRWSFDALYDAEDELMVAKHALWALQRGGLLGFDQSLREWQVERALRNAAEALGYRLVAAEKPPASSKWEMCPQCTGRGWWPSESEQCHCCQGSGDAEKEAA